MKKEPITHGLSREKVIKLLNIGSDMPQTPEDIDQLRADLLIDRLGDSLPLYYSTEQRSSSKLSRLGQTIAALAGEPIGKLLKDPKTDVSTVRMIKNYGRKLSNQSKSEPERHTGNTIYYAAIAHALIYHDLKITKHSHKDLQESFALLSTEDWIPKNLRDLFSEASEYCKARLK